jgi:acyl-CoA thioesterase FadM
MSLYLRLIWTLLRAWRLPQLSLEDVFEREFRVLPNDIDINFHMNNGRYLTVADLMIVEFFARTGFLRTLLKNKWKPVIGGSIITYRKQLKLGQKYKLSYQWVGADANWNYLCFRFTTLDGTLCATGYSKGAALSRKGIVPNARSFEAHGLDQPDMALPSAVLDWNDSEAKLVA